MPYFICPNCKERSVDIDGKDGFSDQAASCRHCGFGFLFELLEDYYPAPNTGLIACDKEGRVLSVGRGVFELTGYEERSLLGQDVTQALALGGFEEGKNPAQIATEWGVRRMGEKLVLTTRGGIEKPITADFFPAYDADGGLLVAVTPRAGAA
jgi:PAS domain S-box-containing protein